MDAVSLLLKVYWPGINDVVTTEGIIGLEKLKAARFDFVILDIKLPDIDGFAVLKQVREFSDVPVIVITAYGNNESRALEMGADAYII